MRLFHCWYYPQAQNAGGRGAGRYRKQDRRDEAKEGKRWKRNHTQIRESTSVGKKARKGGGVREGSHLTPKVIERKDNRMEDLREEEKRVI